MAYVRYRDLIAHLGIQPGSLLVVTADLTRLIMSTRRNEEDFSINGLINSFLEFLGPEGTLVIPSFNFNLKNNGSYDSVRSLPITGALAVEALKRDDFRRTKHPLHSFLVSGKFADELTSLAGASSFGPDSPFAFFKKHNALMLLIDTTVSAAFTFVHHVEEMERVKYRKYRKLRIKMEDDGRTIGREDGRTVGREYVLYAKKPGWTMALEGLEKELEKEGISRKVAVNSSVVTIVDLARSYPIIAHDIHQNNARNLAEFSIEIYLREKAKSILSAFGLLTLADKISHDPGLL